MTYISSTDVLLVEDNRNFAEGIMVYLEKQGYCLDYAHSGKGALGLLERNSYGMLIINAMLPDINGFILTNTIRRTLKADTSVLLINNRDSLQEKLQGFSAGCDDYLITPFAMEELAARIKALIRRASGVVTGALEAGHWRIETSNLKIFYRHQMVKTTNIGFKIFKTLIACYPGVTHRRNLEKIIWDDDPPESDALKSHIFALRKAIASIDRGTRIETVHGVGFRLIVMNK